MSRKKKRQDRGMKADIKYNSLLVTHYVNRIMLNGEKNISFGLIYETMDIIKEKLKDDPLKILVKATENVKPQLEVKARRIGGATYQVPVEVEPLRANALAIRWIINFARARKGKSFSEKLAGELIDAYNEQGSSVKKKIDNHKMAEANKAFAHYKW
ncbi:MAG: 30S ribosomal protein S7 [Endomicrobium sp.]|jgi:small subunit ribosomal protein S7|nr:30S ribosomal protein S7 [Endomicrobium sp.]